MGIFRLVLAATVMLGHFVSFYPNHLPYFVKGDASVPAFYIVSGFLITLVLREKYHDRLSLFYSNRALRIFPLYWAALILFVAVNWIVVSGRPLEPVPVYQYTSALWWAQRHGSEVGLFGTFILVITNVFIFGQDVMLFIGKWPHALNRDYFYHFFMFVGPVWTIAVEFWFYLLAPFVVRKGVFWPVAILITSLAARILVVAGGHTSFINEYDCAPLEMAFFMLGSLAYYAFNILRNRNSLYVKIYTVVSPIIMLVLTVLYLDVPFARPVFLIATTLCLPGIVLAGRQNPLDRICGELSYPVYLLHPIFTIYIVPGTSLFSEITAVALVLAISYLLVRIIERPIEEFRQRRTKTRAVFPGPAPAAALVSTESSG